MVAAFIRERGVTVCPPCGSPELAELHRKREQQLADSGGAGWKAYHARKRHKAGIP